MTTGVWLLGTSMTKFARYPDRDAADLGAEASMGALADGGVSIGDMGVFAVGNRMDLSDMSGGGGLAHRILRQVGQTGIPAYGVMTACASGAAALRIVMMAIKAGEADMGLAVGTEQMGKPVLGAERKTLGGNGPVGPMGALLDTEGVMGTSLMPGVFGHLATEYAAAHEGVGIEQFARVAEKNHAHSTLNPLALYRKQFTLDEIMFGEMIAYPNTMLMCCPNSDGAAAAVLVSEERLASLSPEQRRRAVKISASVMTSDPWVESLQAQFDLNTLTRNAADQAYEQAGVDPMDLDLVELHDCFASAELLHYDNLRLCEPGGAGEFIDSGGPRRDGRLPVNVSGGLLSKGHPLGATGIANIYEVATHLRGEAADRQITGATVGLTHVVGIGSTCAVHILERRANSQP